VFIRVYSWLLLKKWYTIFGELSYVKSFFTKSKYAKCQLLLLQKSPTSSQETSSPAASFQKELRSPQEMARHHSQHGRFQEAIGEYKKILALNPKDAEAHLDLAILYMGQNMYKNLATNHLQKVLEISPAHPKKTSILLWLRTLQSESEAVLGRVCKLMLRSKKIKQSRAILASLLIFSNMP
jgi:Flp pilus assembly protein TadD